jgi:hypothetical protein
VAQFGEQAGIVARLPAGSEDAGAVDADTPSDADTPPGGEIVAAANTPPGEESAAAADTPPGEESAAPADTPPDEQIAAAADTVLVEYLLMDELSHMFPGTEFVPYGYPLENLRGPLRDRVAGLSDSDRQTLLEQVDARQWYNDPERPVISNPRSPVIYEGPDAEVPGPGLIPIEPDPQSVEK